MKINATTMDLLARVLGAVFGGYLLAHTFCIALFGLLPMTQSDATLAATQSGFVVYTVAVLWAFAARSGLTACLGILVPTGITGLITWVII